MSDPDESRAGYRSGEGADSVLHHLLAAARRKQRNRPLPDSLFPSHPPSEPDSTLDIQLPP